MDDSTTNTQPTIQPEHTMRVDTNAKHRELLRLKLAGVDNKECGTLLDISLAQVGMIVKSPLFQSQLRALQNESDERAFDVVDCMKRATKEASETVLEVMRDAPQYATKLSAAKTVLALAGHGSDSPQRVENNQYNLTFEQKMREFETLGSANLTPLPVAMAG
jgi:hypothetical protein